MADERLAVQDCAIALGHAIREGKRLAPLDPLMIEVFLHDAAGARIDCYRIMVTRQPLEEEVPA